MPQPEAAGTANLNVQRAAYPQERSTRSVGACNVVQGEGKGERSPASVVRTLVCLPLARARQAAPLEPSSFREPSSFHVCIRLRVFPPQAAEAAKKLESASKEAAAKAKSLDWAAEARPARSLRLSQRSAAPWGAPARSQACIRRRLLLTLQGITRSSF